MHPLHDYLAKQVADKLKAHSVVVWYDARGELAPFIDELRGQPRRPGSLMQVLIGGSPVALAQLDGSFFEVRALVEPLVSRDSPEAVVIYAPGVKHDDRGSVLMELEKAGVVYAPTLNKLARHVLKQRYTEGIIDEKLASAEVTYEDVARMASDEGGTSPSLLRAILPDVPSGDPMVAAWLATPDHDAAIVKKGATAELAKLIQARLGVDLTGTTDLAKLRAATLRYVLGNEFRLDLRAPAPSTLDSLPKPKTKDEEARLRAFAVRLRNTHPDQYATMADGIEAQLGLTNTSLPADALGAIDTFRFEERALLGHCATLVATRRCADALAIVAEREASFWLDRNLERRAQWEAMRLMAEVGATASEVRAAIGKVGGDAQAWVRAYASEGGWFRLDQAQRRLEMWIARLDDGPDEKALGIVRLAYEDTCQAMANGFANTLAEGGWQVRGELHQSHVFDEVVSSRPKPVAYFLVDAMRYEMGADLRDRLAASTEVTLRPAIAALPTITPMGMAALHPGASTNYNVVAEQGELGASIGDIFLPDITARQKYFAARVPKVVDLSLPELLGLQPSRLAKKIENAQIIVVRSQDIDLASETGLDHARMVMDAVLGDLARAIRRLGNAGVEHVVLSADHGHLFFAVDRDASMRVDRPVSGDTVDLHRRCWIGRGGTTPPGCARVSAAQLGYASDLEFVFPGGTAIFKAGGDAAFHHGGPTLQELIVPVLTIRIKNVEPSITSSKITISSVPTPITNRIFTAVIEFREQLTLGRSATSTIAVRPALISSGKSVGEVGMVVGAELDRATGTVHLVAGKSATIAFRIIDDEAKAFRIVVLDPTNDAELYRSPADLTVQLGL